MEPVDRVRDMVRHALVTDPAVTNRELMERARQLAPTAVEGLTLQQFHARFRLPVLRNEMAARKDKGKKKEEPARPRRRATAVVHAPLRTSVREIFVRFAVDMESADNRGQLVQVVSGLDACVDEILRLAREHYVPAEREANGSASHHSAAPRPAAVRADVAVEAPAPPAPRPEPMLRAERPLPLNARVREGGGRFRKAPWES